MFKYLTHYARNKKHRHEGDHVRHDAEGHRHGNLPGTANGRIYPGKTLLAIVVYVFARDNGVINHNSEGNYEGEHGNHVYTCPERRKYKKRSEKRDRNSKTDPKGKSSFKKNGEQDKYQA